MNELQRESEQFANCLLHSAAIDLALQERYVIRIKLLNCVIQPQLHLQSCHPTWVPLFTGVENPCLSGSDKQRVKET